MKKKLYVVLAVFALFLGGCADNYGASEKAALNIGNGIAAGMKSVDALRVNGQISVQEETNVLGFLKFLNDGNGAFAACAQAAHNAGSKAGAYTACASTFQATLSNPQELALIHVNNPTAQQDVQLIVAGLNTGITSLLTGLGGH